MWTEYEITLGQVMAMMVFEILFGVLLGMWISRRTLKRAEALVAFVRDEMKRRR